MYGRYRIVVKQFYSRRDVYLIVRCSQMISVTAHTERIANCLTEALTGGRRSDPGTAAAVEVVSGGVSGPCDVAPPAPVGRVESWSSLVHGPAGRSTGVFDGRRQYGAPVLYTRVVGLAQPVFMSLLVLSDRLLPPAAVTSRDVGSVTATSH